MPTSSNIATIQQGTPASATATVTFLGIGSAGDPDACRILTHPDALLAPITYAVGGVCFNPKRTLNLDNDVLMEPSTEPVRTLGTSRVVRFEEQIGDVIVTEIWPAAGGLSMPTFLFRLFYEYLINPVDYTIGQTSFITWEPRDRNSFVYNVELLSLTVGGSPTGTDHYDVLDLRPRGGDTVKTGVENLNATATGLIDREVRLRMRIIGKVS